MQVVGDLVIPEMRLIADDGEFMDSPWHRSQMNLLIESILYHWRDRTDYYVGGKLSRSLGIFRRDSGGRYRGPDFFVVQGVDGRKPRRAWVVWEEDGRYPDVIIELLSPTTLREDTGYGSEKGNL
ncbi:MAG: Uma2 family endonuclease [Acidobacteria bacterium]|nr:Uma2 family endonuclease [Acidobacteriota bacterium]MDW7984052.1 Uma2 family endonuclease [Acidobacteriota bacterium]